ncbi:MAG: hypothetical protein KKG33_03890 [candidate division Zixibacteria bacterium]|nr:hypothetical protein [candidate division Zixibacteria bacterium]MBU2624687.1 hypothetical protein [candidate division Zixibacteria bacterium]
MKREALRNFRTLAVMSLVTVVLLLTVPVMAQDIGYPDTVRYSPQQSTWTLDTYGETHSIELWTRCDDINVFGATLGFRLTTSTGGGTGHDDSLIVVDTFLFSMSADFLMCNLSALDSASLPQSVHSQFNGCMLDIVNVFSGPLFFPPGNTTKIGTMKIRSLNPTQLPQQFDITVDSTWFPPNTEFVFAPSPGTPFPPQFTGATVHVDNILGGTDPVIQLDPTTIEFIATEGEGNPPTQVVNISNAGTGLLQWTAGDDAPWLVLSPTSGMGDGSITLHAYTYGYTPGTYLAMMTVAAYAENSPQYVTVSLTINEAIPVIELDKSSMYFSGITLGPNPATQTFSITNVGDGTLDWAATDDATWLTCDPSSAVGDRTVTVEIDKTGLSAGIHTATISVEDPSASNSPQEIAVTLELLDTPPVIAVDKSFLFFEKVIGEPDPSAQTLTISNVGGQSLDWTATKTNLWVVLSASSGIAPSTINVSVTITPTTTDYYFDTIMVSGDALNSPEMTIICLYVNQGPFDWGDADCSGAVDIDDVVYMIAYIFAGGPPPGDPDDNGIQDCS